jgi:hypothetical protein
MDRDKQRQRIQRVRRSVVSGSVTGALALAGYLGFVAQADATTATDTGSSTSSSTSTYDASTDTSGNGFDSSDLGDTAQLSAGSSSSHATTSGS